MGALAAKIFEVVTKRKGFQGRLQLANKTGISRDQATRMEDTSELIQKLKEAADHVVGEDIDSYMRD